MLAQDDLIEVEIECILKDAVPLLLLDLSARSRLIGMRSRLQHLKFRPLHALELVFFDDRALEVAGISAMIICATRINLTHFKIVNFAVLDYL